MSGREKRQVEKRDLAEEIVERVADRVSRQIAYIHCHPRRVGNIPIRMC